jgi:hypothetical protein
MTTSTDDDREMHRRLGIQLFNQTWDLIDRTDRDADDDIQMLLTAAASRWHWGQLGAPDRVSTGDWQVAHVASLVGIGELARRFASRSLAIVESEGWDGWRLASAHEGMARACAALGDADGCARHVAAARSALEHEPEEEERRVIESQLATIPGT